MDDQAVDVVAAAGAGQHDMHGSTAWNREPTSAQRRRATEYGTGDGGHGGPVAHVEVIGHPRSGVDMRKNPDEMAPLHLEVKRRTPDGGDEGGPGSDTAAQGQQVVDRVEHSATMRPAWAPRCVRWTAVDGETTLGTAPKGAGLAWPGLAGPRRCGAGRGGDIGRNT